MGKEERMIQELVDRINETLEDNQHERNKWQVYVKAKRRIADYQRTVKISSEEYDKYIEYITDKLQI